MALHFPTSTTTHETDAFGQVGYHMHDDPVVHHLLRTLRVSQWRFNQGHFLRDDIGNNTLTNINSVDQTARDFIEGNASAEFGVSNDKLEIADTPTLASNQIFSISLWVRPHTVTSFQSIFSKDNTFDKREYNLLVDNLSKFIFFIGNGESIVDLGPTDPTDVIADTWYHLVVTHNTVTDVIQLFTNGQLVDSYTYINLTLGSSGEPIRIGGDGSIGGNSMSSGSRIDNVIWFNSVLTQEQVSYLHEHPNFF